MSHPHPLAALFGDGPSQEANPTHKLAPEAQAENLKAAWAHYSAPKAFVPGQLLRGRAGLGVYRKEPVLLYVRALDLTHEIDRMLVEGATSQGHWNKLDCVCAQVSDEAGLVFMPCDSDILEPYP